ncbi:spermidine/putrescine ABC transporter substrate-binding protein [bacterium]|nr:spermidine/putrescine ABC transporter substrate-binding protein [bacterium]
MSKIKNKFITCFSEGTCLRRGVIIVAYTSILCCMLYAPKLVTLFRTDTPTLNVYVFSDIIMTHAFQKFESETGIQVNVKRFDSNEELMSQFRFNRGEGYDLIAPSDYMVETMHKEGLLAPIDTDKIERFTRLDNRLKNKQFDPENKYSVPYAWSTVGIGFNKKFFAEKYPTSWRWIFEPPKSNGEKDFKICLTEDSREIAFLANIYLHGNVSGFEDKTVRSEIRRTLVKQHQWVESYTDSDLRYFLESEIVPLVLINSGRMARIISNSDEFDFAVPDEGTVITIENFAIPATSNRKELAQKLIDFLLSRETSVETYNECGFNPANQRAYADIDKSVTDNKSFFPDDEIFERLFIMHNNIPSEYISNLWIDVRIR